jgi:hypothetical protein
MPVQVPTEVHFLLIRPVLPCAALCCVLSLLGLLTEVHRSYALLDPLCALPVLPCLCCSAPRNCSPRFIPLCVLCACPAVLSACLCCPACVCVPPTLLLLPCAPLCLPFCLPPPVPACLPVPMCLCAYVLTPTPVCLRVCSTNGSPRFVCFCVSYTLHVFIFCVCSLRFVHS